MNPKMNQKTNPKTNQKTNPKTNQKTNQIIIRKETQEDYHQTEEMTMRAFWNLHGPGCSEHYLVHLLRDARCYLPELSRVAILDGKIVGAIFYSRAEIRDGENTHEILTFGPLSVEPTAQSLGIGGLLLAETKKLAKEAGYPGICFFGEPDYYPRHGFVTSDHFGITDPDGNYSDALQCCELREHAMDPIHGKFYEDSVFEACDAEPALTEFTKQFPYWPPLTLSCQWLHRQRLGRICEVQKNAFRIRYWEQELPARLSGLFFQKDLEFPVTGDYVTFDYNPRGDSRIVSVCERSSLLKRPDQSGHAIGYVKTMKEQVMIANFDYVFITVSLNDNYNYNRIARYVTATLQGGGIPVVILTKADLCADPSSYIAEVQALSERVKVHAVSAISGAGLADLSAYLAPGTTIALLGSSGVGKSTLLNALAGKELMKTAAIRETDAKGRHTTTHRQLFLLPGHITIIDTPGMREFGVCDVEAGIEDTFADVTEWIGKCRFRDCKHDREPGCAIRQALADGSLTRERYELYVRLQSESRHNAEMKSPCGKQSPSSKAIARKRRQLSSQIH